MSDEPLASVIIPARDAANHIQQQLRALAGQLRVDEVEILVVDNASTDATTELARAVGIPGLRIVSCTDGRGPGHVRNHGIREARGGILLFCDADDVVSDDWLASMVRAAERHSLFGGPIDVTSLDPLPGPDRPGLALPRDLDWRPWGIGCNLGMRRDVIDRIGLFHELYACAEDVEFSWRAARAGIPFDLVEGAVVHYRPRSNARSAFDQGFRWGLAAPRLVTDFRADGFTGRGWIAAVRDWGRLLRHSPGIVGSQRDRREAARLAGLLLGRLAGSVRHRAFLP